jgi:isocitrate dehydrogenase
MEPKIIYTITDEAPALATYSLFPIVKAFTGAVGVDVETRDISLAGRILAVFPDYLTPEQRVSDDLTELGKLVQEPDANVIKLPNISASLPQITETIKELQAQGFPVPDYPMEPQSDKEKEIKARYDRVKGSAVNPVLREGNSDRRAPRAVKEYARKHPHSMGEWTPDSKSHISSMDEGDYFGSETSTVVPGDTTATIRFVADDGSIQVLKDDLALTADEVIDSAVLRRDALRAFFKREIADAKAQGVLFSVHLKATMMKISDPIIFGHVVGTYFEPVFTKWADLFQELKISPNNGLRDLYSRIESLPQAQRDEIKADIDRCFDEGPGVSMVDSDRGITSFHVPSDFIIDATIPAAIRSSGKTWAPDGSQQDTKFVVPDRSYSAIYQTVIDDCKANGAFDPTTMGSVSNVGLMARKAEEYGSHDKTFEIAGTGRVEIVAGDGTVLLTQDVADGDIFRACQVKDVAVRAWVSLAVRRARETNTPAVFWLNSERAHDAQLIEKVQRYLKEHDTSGLEIHTMAPAQATKFSIDRIRQGKDTISVTGNVLRDYLTDLFPILELGTSAKMLSIVPLLNGGGLFETGAAGSAPKHVQQFVREGHLRWDSLGEFLALTASLEHLASTFDNEEARILADALDAATGEILDAGKSPSRKVNELDNRGSHFYLALYWSQAMAERAHDPQVKERFSKLADALKNGERQILTDLIDHAQGNPVEIGGYFHPDAERVEKAMRPSAALNEIIDRF